MLNPTVLLAPSPQDSSFESKVMIGPRALKDMIDHFPVNKGAKSDPQLVWAFAEDELILKSLDSSIDARGLVQFLTHLHTLTYGTARSRPVIDGAGHECRGIRFLRHVFHTHHDSVSSPRVQRGSNMCCE